jgi:hypothetical protein
LSGRMPPRGRQLQPVTRAEMAASAVRVVKRQMAVTVATVAMVALRDLAATVGQASRPETTRMARTLAAAALVAKAEQAVQSRVLLAQAEMRAMVPRAVRVATVV